MTGRRNIDKRRVLTFASVTVVSVGVFVFGSRLLLGATMIGPEPTATMFDRLHPSGAWGKLATLEAAGEGNGPHPLRRRGAVDLTNREPRHSAGVRVACAMGWCYVNGRGEMSDRSRCRARDGRTAEDTAGVRAVERVAFPSAVVRGACDLGTRHITPSQARERVPAPDGI